MSTKDAWIDQRLSEAREGNDLVTDSVETALRQSLAGIFCERKLTSKELTVAALNLLAETGIGDTKEKEEPDED